VLNPPSTEPTTSDKRVLSTLPPPEPFRLYDFKSLPASVKENLPDINISVFVYSDDPSSRVVKINGHTVREGQELTDGLKLEKIVPEGVIFKYEEYKFRVRVR
jgi:general secretion pathway protein B